MAHSGSTPIFRKGTVSKPLDGCSQGPPLTKATLHHPLWIYCGRAGVPHHYLTLLPRIADKALLSSMASAVSSPWL